MWVLVLLAMSIDGGPDVAIVPPVEQPVQSEADCHKAAAMAWRAAMRSSGKRIEFLYECRPPAEGATS